MKKETFRICLACRKKYNKYDMLRVVKSQSDVSIDYTGKCDGRGAYICNSEECIKKCVKSRLLNRTFKRDVSPDVYNKMLEDYLIAKGQN